MADRTSNFGMYEIDDDRPNWHHFYNYNVDILNNFVLKILNLNDVSFQSLQNGAILKWDVTTKTWKVTYNREP